MLCAQSIGIGYYNLDGLYDTLPSQFYDDSAYTPTGRYLWTQERYQQKISNIAAVIDSISLPIVGLYGVETEAVVRDIVMRSGLDYTYVHRTRNSFDGQDFALLYFGDKLFIDRVESQRNMLIVDGSLGNQTPITILLTLNGADCVDFIRENPRDNLVVALGKLYVAQIKDVGSYGFVNALEESEGYAQGNYCSYRGWVMYDRIMVNQKEKILKSGVYITPWLLTPDGQAPRPTYSKGAYLGGYSRYLPIFIYIV